MHTHCVYTWCVHVVCTRGVYMWCVHVVCTCGVYVWCVHVVCTCGVYMWCVRVVCTRGVYMWCVHVVCTCGVYVWCVHVVCHGTVYSKLSKILNRLMSGLSTSLSCGQTNSCSENMADEGFTRWSSGSSTEIHCTFCTLCQTIAYLE